MKTVLAGVLAWVIVERGARPPAVVPRALGGAAGRALHGLPDLRAGRPAGRGRGRRGRARLGGRQHARRRHGRVWPSCCWSGLALGSAAVVPGRGDDGGRHRADRPHHRRSPGRTTYCSPGWPTPGSGSPSAWRSTSRCGRRCDGVRRSRRWTRSTTAIGELLVDIADGLAARLPSDEDLDGLARAHPRARRGRRPGVGAGPPGDRERAAQPASLRGPVARPGGLDVAPGADRAGGGRDPQHGPHPVPAAGARRPLAAGASATGTRVLR